MYKQCKIMYFLKISVNMFRISAATELIRRIFWMFWKNVPGMWCKFSIYMYFDGCLFGTKKQLTQRQPDGKAPVAFLSIANLQGNQYENIFNVLLECSANAMEVFNINQFGNFDAQKGSSLWCPLNVFAWPDPTVF